MRDRHFLLRMRFAAGIIVGLLLAGCHHEPGADLNSMSAADQKKAFSNSVPMTQDLMQKNIARQNAIGAARMGAHTPPASVGASAPQAH